MTTTPDPQAAAEALKEAMALLARAGELLPQVVFLTRAAWDSADTALMIADNEAKLALDAVRTTPPSAPTGYRYVESVVEGEWVLERILHADEHDKDV